MLYVEPAGGNPDIFSRGFKTVFFAQQATADHQGDVWANWHRSPAARTSARRRPPTRRSTTRSRRRRSEGIEKILKKAGIKTVYRKTYTGETRRTSTRSPTRSRRRTPTSSSPARQFEDGVGFMRALDKVGFTPKWLYQTNAPSFGDQYAEGVGVENTEGVFYAVSHSQEAKTPGNAGVRRQVQGDVRRRRAVPEDAADALRGGAGPAGHGRGQQDGRARPTSSSSPTGCARTRVDDDPRHAELERGRRPKGEFLDRPVAERQAGDRAARGRGDVATRSSRATSA